MPPRIFIPKFLILGNEAADVIAGTVAKAIAVAEQDAERFKWHVARARLVQERIIATTLHAKEAAEEADPDEDQEGAGHGAAQGPGGVGGEEATART